MAIINYAQPTAKFFSVLADGKFHHSVTANTEGATLREYETSDGKKGEKWELVASSITGKLENLTIREGEYGKQLHVIFAKDDDTIEPVVVSLNVTSNFGEDFMKKLPNIDLDQDVTLSPYSFEDDKGKNRKGISITQNSVKITDYYKDVSGEKPKTINGYPKVPVESKKWDSDDWKVYFTQARKFLMAETEKSPIWNQEYVKPESHTVSELESEFAEDELPSIT